MRRLLVLTLLLFGFWACNDNDLVKNPGYTLTDSIVEVNAEGGDFSVGYTIDAAIDGVNALAVCDAEWVYDIDCSTYGSISFRVTANTGITERETTIELRYPSLDVRPQIVVRQSGFSTSMLTLNLTAIDYSECSIAITPKDVNMPYIVMMAEKEYLTAKGIKDEASLVAADIDYFSSIAGNERTIEELFDSAGIALRGAQQRSWNELSPAKEYVIYAYGVAIEGNDFRRTTPVSHLLIDSRLPERKSVEFEATITADGPEVAFEVRPTEWQGYYMVQIIEDSEAGYIPDGEPITEDTECAIAEAFFYIADHLYYFEELSAEEIMSQLGYCGDASFSKTLNANHDYMALIYAIDSTDGNVPMVVSHPEVEYFSTGAVERSDMTFEVEFSNILPRSVDVTITPSTDESYTAVIMYASNLPEGSSDEQLAYIEANYAPFEISGPYSEHIDQLPPSTEFVLCIYGYYAGTPTTDLFTYCFTTAADGVGNNMITEVRATAYDLAEVAALEPYYASLMGYADYFLSVEIITSELPQALHFDILPVKMLDEYSLDEIREMLLEDSYTSSPDWALGYYGNEYVVCGLVEDRNGYIGDMYVSEPISFARNETSAAEEFVELYADYVPKVAARNSLVVHK